MIKFEGFELNNIEDNIINKELKTHCHILKGVMKALGAKEGSTSTSQQTLLTGEQKDELLKTIDCAINIDKADSNGLFTIENLLYKNLVITQKQSASCDFIIEDNGLLVDRFSANVDMIKQYDNSIHSMYEYWYEADFTSLKQKMREACTISTAALKLKKINIDDSILSYTNFVESVLC